MERQGDFGSRGTTGVGRCHPGSPWQPTHSWQGEVQIWWSGLWTVHRTWTVLRLYILELKAFLALKYFQMSLQRQHQPSRGHSITTATQSGSPNNYVGQQQISISLCNAYSRFFEQGHWPNVTRESSIRGLNSTSLGGESNMVEIGTGCRRSLYLAGKRSVPSILLPVSCQHSFGPSLAQEVALCIPASESPWLCWPLG